MVIRERSQLRVPLGTFTYLLPLHDDLGFPSKQPQLTFPFPDKQQEACYNALEEVT